jgi:transposase
MRLMISKSENAQSLYVIKSVYKNGKRTTKIVERLGTYDHLSKKLKGEDPIAWAKEYIENLNKKEKTQSREILVKFSPAKRITQDKQVSFNGGYIFLQDIYHKLKLDKICKEISDKHRFEFDLNEILSRLLYTRILYPSSKLSSFNASKRFIEQPSFELQHVYRALEVISKESDMIESEVYRTSLNLAKRNTNLLYYDCTNYFFETEQSEGLKQYGISKEHRPNPIIQMGLFMDGDGIPLAFTIFEGNKNEQPTLKPLEERIISDFKLSRFVVCTDAGLGSHANRLFNTKQDRSYIVTQSLHKLRKHLIEWSLDPGGWSLSGSDSIYNLDEINDSSENTRVYFKERWINENGLEQKLIVTYSPRHKAYQQSIREGQISRARKMADNNMSPDRKKQNDPNRFLNTTHYTQDGEVAGKKYISVDENRISEEERFDGFYAVCTNLEDDPETIIKVTKRRWEIEESFRILKSEFKARPVYLSRDDRIKAHFMTCFLSLLIYRLLEKKLGEKFTCSTVVSQLRDMNFLEIPYEGYVPTYVRNDVTDALHDSFGFHTDYQIVTEKNMKKILNETKR